jgi:hypothetical protein
MIKKIIFTLCSSIFFILLPLQASNAELVAVNDEALNAISGQSGITINTRVILGDETSIIFSETGGESLEDAKASGDISYLIFDKISGEIEIKGLAFDLISDLKNSGKAALQWTLPETIKMSNLKTEGIYASSTETIDTDSTFLLGAQFDGTLSLPANTQISLFVVD